MVVQLLKKKEIHRYLPNMSHEDMRKSIRLYVTALAQHLQHSPLPNISRGHIGITFMGDMQQSLND